VRDTTDAEAVAAARARMVIDSFILIFIELGALKKEWSFYLWLEK
jgi:hypothetical protein